MRLKRSGVLLTFINILRILMVHRWKPLMIEIVIGEFLCGDNLVFHTFPMAAVMPHFLQAITQSEVIQNITVEICNRWAELHRMHFTITKESGVPFPRTN